MIGFITGTGFYNYPNMDRKIIETKFGNAEVLVGKIEGKDIAIICRHGEKHEFLPNHINFKANLMALKKLGVNCVLSFSVAGVINPDLPLNKGAIINDLFTPDNRLPNGEICTIFNKPGEKGRGHLIAKSFFNSKINKDIKEILKDDLVEDACYVYSIGPRFNSKAEIRNFRNIGGDYVSQTCGPEAVLACELELPYAQFVYGVDYANGVKKEATPMDELGKNIENSTEVFKKVLRGLLKKENKYSFEGFIYRFN